MRSIIAAIAISCLGGCCLPVGVVRYYRPDPQRDKAVEITAVEEDGFIALADGRRIRLAGIHASPNLNPALARDILHDQRELLVGRRVLVDANHDGTARLTDVGDRRSASLQGPMCPLLELTTGGQYQPYDAMVLVLIPIIIPVDEREDVAKRLCREGLARAEADAPKALREAQQHARDQHAGMWMTHDQRLLDLIKRGQPRDVEGYLAAGADPNTAGRHHSALVIAIDSKNIETVRVLLRHGASPNAATPSGTLPLTAACRGGVPAITQALIEAGADVHAQSGDALYHAAEKADEPTIRLLLVAGADPAAYARENHNPIVPLVTGRGQETNNLQIIRLLVEHGGDINGLDVGSFSTDTPLSAASKCDRRAIADYLIKQGADVDKCNPLSGACFYENIEMARLLIAGGANVNRASEREIAALPPQATPLYVAAYKRNEELVHLLLKNGANPAPKDNLRNPMVGLCRRGEEAKALEIMKLLVAHGGDINARDIDKTPLHAAVMADAPRLVEYLLKQGADTTVTQADGKTPLALAKYWGQDEIVKLLKAHGAER
jgi:ankyrin repeat protein